MLFSLLPRTGPSQPAHLMAWNLARNCLSLGSAQAEHRHLQLKCFTVSATNELPLLGVSTGRTSTSKHIIFQVLRQLDWTDLVLLQTHWTFPELTWTGTALTDWTYPGLTWTYPGLTWTYPGLTWLTDPFLDWPKLVLLLNFWTYPGLNWTGTGYRYWLTEPILDWPELILILTEWTYPGLTWTNTDSNWLNLSWTDLNLYCYWLTEPILDWPELILLLTDWTYPGLTWTCTGWAACPVAPGRCVAYSEVRSSW